MSDSSGEEEFNDEVMEEGEEGEVEEADGKRAARKSVTSYAEDDDDDDDDDEDSDDDIPLAMLAKKAKQNAKNGSKKSPAAKKASSAKKPPPPARKTSNVSSSGGSSDKKYEFVSAALYQSESLKGLLIQRLLCRWWYAYQWPDPTTLPAKPPQNYDALDGFPGVYVCTSGDKVGKLLDLRDKDECPSFRTFVNKPAAELQKLLLKALKEQKAQLVQHEGAGTSAEKELDSLIKWTTKVDTNKAEKECVKVLKASKLQL